MLIVDIFTDLTCAQYDFAQPYLELSWALPRVQAHPHHSDEFLKKEKVLSVLYFYGISS